MYLLDTNHCFELMNRNARLVERIASMQEGDVGFVTSIVVGGELEFGAAKSQRRMENASNVRAFLDDLEVVGIDRRAATMYGDLKAKLVSHFGPKDRSSRSKFNIQSIGISDNDLWVAATALSEELVVVTTDSDFDRIREVDSRLRQENWLTPA